MRDMEKETPEGAFGSILVQLSIESNLEIFIKITMGVPGGRQVAEWYLLFALQPDLWPPASLRWEALSTSSITPHGFAMATSTWSCMRPMCRPPPYVDLGKAARNLFKNKFGFGLVKLEVKPKLHSDREFSASGLSETDTGKVTGALRSHIMVWVWPPFTEKWNTDDTGSRNHNGRLDLSRFETDIWYHLFKHGKEKWWNQAFSPEGVYKPLLCFWLLLCWTWEPWLSCLWLWGLACWVPDDPWQCHITADKDSLCSGLQDWGLPAAHWCQWWDRIWSINLWESMWRS